MGNLLIVNADDFGQSEAINSGVIEAFEEGILTSASLMVRWPAAAAASKYGKAHPELSVGLHLDLGEWELNDSQWRAKYEVVDLSDEESVELEVGRQLKRFEKLMGRLPTHIDSHQHVHRQMPVRSAALELAMTLGVPLRHFDRRISYVGDFYGQTEEGITRLDWISAESLKRIVSKLPAQICELACHPAEYVDFDSMYALERVRELQSLCDYSLTEHLRLADVRLGSFHTIRGGTEQQ